jgi:hypothetical protein
MRRSMVLAERGVLVGQFAERAAPLAEAVCRNGAVTSIHELFSGILNRWWANSFHKGEATETTLAGSGIGHWCDPSGHPVPGQRTKRAKALQRRYRKAVTLHPSVLTPRALRTKLRATRPMRLGQIHGDLNARNVLVRDEMPLVIDFSHCMDGPLLADPAWLEVTLVFNWDWSRSSPRTASARRAGWHEAVSQLYVRAWFDRAVPLHLGEPFGDELHRVCNAVRLVRRHSAAVSTSGENYREVVCAALLRFACSDVEPGKPRQREAAEERAVTAYALASSLLTGTPL